MKQRTKFKKIEHGGTGKSRDYNEIGTQCQKSKKPSLAKDRNYW